MNTRIRPRVLLAASALLVSGCASSLAATPTSAHTSMPAGSAMSSGMMMSPGMVMPDGSTMGAPSSGAGDGAPTAAEKMICADETHADITKILGLTTTPTSTATWAGHRYTCRYTLPMGALVVSVKQSADPAAAKSYFADLRMTLAPAQTLQGLGEASYGNAGGTVVLIKDSDVLTVDATALPPVFGAQQSKRFDFAYELASDILGCWTGG